MQPIRSKKQPMLTANVGPAAASSVLGNCHLHHGDKTATILRCFSWLQTGWCLVESWRSSNLEVWHGWHVPQDIDASPWFPRLKPIETWLREMGSIPGQLIRALWFLVSPEHQCWYIPMSSWCWLSPYCYWWYLGNYGWYIFHLWANHLDHHVANHLIGCAFAPSLGTIT